MNEPLAVQEAPAGYVLETQPVGRASARHVGLKPDLPVIPPGYKCPKGYKQTEVGVIPEDWESIALAHLSAFITKGSTPTTYGFKWEPSEVLFLRSEIGRASCRER